MFFTIPFWLSGSGLDASPPPTTIWTPDLIWAVNCRVRQKAGQGFVVWMIFTILDTLDRQAIHPGKLPEIL